MNYYQFEQEPKPRFTYLRDKDTRLITASVRLSNRKVYVGDPCVDPEKALGSAAKKAYEVMSSFLLFFHYKHIALFCLNLFIFNRKMKNLVRSIGNILSLPFPQPFGPDRQNI